MSVTIYHKKTGSNNNPVNVSITNVYATTGSVSLNESWSYYFDRNGLRKSGSQTCSLIITSETNNLAMVQNILMSSFTSKVNTTTVSNMLILSNLSKGEYSSFNLPIGKYNILLVPEQVRSSDIGLSISDQKPDLSLEEKNFSSLSINYDVSIIDNSGASTDPNGPTVTFNNSYEKDRVVFITEKMPLDKFEPSGSSHSNNIYNVNSNAVLLKTEHTLFKNENGELSKQSSDVTEPGEYYSKYEVVDKYGIKKELGFNVYVFKVLKNSDLNLVGNMTSTHLAIHRKNVSDFISSGNISKYSPKFMNSQGKFSSELVLFADTESSCSISVNDSSVVVENSPVVNVANIYIEESINKDFNASGTSTVSMTDILTSTGLSIFNKYGLKFSNNESKKSISFDSSIKVEGGQQKYEVGYSNSSQKTLVYLTNSSNSPSVTAKSVSSVDVANQSSLDKLRTTNFDTYFSTDSPFGIKSSSISFGEVTYSNGLLKMSVEGTSVDSFDKSLSKSSMIILNNKQSTNFNVSLTGTINYPKVSMDNINVKRTSIDVFSLVSGYPSPMVDVELGSQKMSRKYEGSSSSGSITLSESDLTSLFTGNNLTLSVSMNGSKKNVSVTKNNVSVSGFSPKINAYTGKSKMEAISFNNDLSIRVNQSIFKNISDSIGIKSASLSDSNGRSLSLFNSSGNKLSLNNDKVIGELRMNDILTKAGTHHFTLTVTNLVGSSSSKSFSMEIVNINKKIVEKSAWGFVKYLNPTDANMEFMILEQTGSASVDINNSSTYNMVNTDKLGSGQSMIKCLPNRITLSVNGNTINGINKCGDIEIWASIGSIKHKLSSFYSDDLRPSVIC